MRFVLIRLAAVAVFAASLRSFAATPAELQEQVRQAENAFAATMSARDFAAFSAFLSEEAVFFSDRNVARGKSAVQAAWRPLYEGPKAPFSWRSESVEVLPSGTLAHSSGPVLDANGKQVATFNSIWRLEDGKWRVIFDKGCNACECAK